jgi:glutathione synthase/RimK-type ligase-like ATP-grasp enzyme
MAGFYVVVDDLRDWTPYFPSRDVISFEQYMALSEEPGRGRTRIINCCRNSRSLGRGYYCSLLAEARGHNVIPSVQVINDLRRKSLWSLELEGVEAALDKLALAEGDQREQIDVKIFFGDCDVPQLAPLARQLFERFPIPLLEVRLKRERGWRIQRIRQGALRDLAGEEQDLFAQALDRFSNRIWRRQRARRHYRYDMAMLVNPEEKLPPSDRTAIARFVRAGKRLGINVQLIGRQDYQRLAEYDALFIRETTAIDHHTYRFARKAEAEGLVVMDDPTSILRCTNKVYLADLLRTHRVPTPKTRILSDASAETVRDLIEALGLPVVLKIPDGAFSRGVIKVESADALTQALKKLRQSSSLVLAQEFMYTDYDWRIGVLNNKPLYACRYFMVQDHWQIYRHDGGSEPDSGGFDTPATWEVPRKVLDVALKAARLIGDGFYGVDIKQSGERVVVIEVNDNPSIDSGVEDLQLGGALYHEIMAEFLRRLELKRQMPA